MAKTKTSPTSRSTGKSLVIVESPAKARTIAKFLGKEFTVEASIGHVRDLPEGAKDVPAEYKGQPWARLGVNVDQGFEPLYVIPASKKAHVAKLRQALKSAKDLYLATDEDREGEAISWHLCEILKPKVPVRRLVFHEITEEAIRESLSHPRQIDDQLVRAQETRRILDRLYGYEVSPLLWRKIGPRLSAGRVQSVAVRLIVDRERQRMEFVSSSYWDLVATFVTAEGKTFEATLVSLNGRRVPSGKDFDSKTGRIKDANLLLLDESAARRAAEQLLGAEFRVAELENRPYTSRPAPPFTTSTLQQEANRKLGFTARRTMDVAQSLYENGYITYMRTDSTNLAQVAIDAARELVRTEYGGEYLPATPRVYKSSVKNAQEAHEAIRPAGHPFKLPETLRQELSPDQFRLFEMIWKRTIASQMNDARGMRISIQLAGGGSVFQVSGKTIDFPGFLRAYVEGSDDPEAELADRETLLPTVTPAERLDCRQLVPKGHATQPPARYSEASLTQTLEEMGIGRPSTYASIIDTILARQYVFKKSNALVPTWTAFSVARLLEKHLPNLVDYQFTAHLEDLLDAISRGEAEQVDYLRRFYFGNGQPGLKQTLEDKVKEVDARDLSRFSVGSGEVTIAGDLPAPIFVRVGRYGPFLEHGGRRAALPDGMAPDELTVDKAVELLTNAQVEDQPLGTDPVTSKPVFVKHGRFGPYVQLGTADDDEKPKYASLLKGMVPTDVTLELALRLLSLPRTVGAHPESGQPIVAQNGRFGPFLRCGDETRSLPAELSPLDVTLDQALHLLAQPKASRGAGRGRAAAEPLKVLGESPVTGQPVKLLAGRYGLYLADGQTNATLPKDVQPEELTFAQALALLAEREGKGGGRRRAAPRGRATGRTAKSSAKTPSSAKRATGDSPPAAPKPRSRGRKSTN
ncbi:MAG: type I DNA topoisomerase [Pirellulales bacterium]